MNIFNLKNLLMGELVLNFALCPHVFATVSGDNCGTNCSYTLSDDGILNLFPTDPSQPASMNTFRENSNIKSVNIAYGFTYLPGDAFIRCSRLTSVTLPASMKSIGVYAFEGTSLRNIIIPESVTYINRDAFHGTNALQTMTISSENVDKIIFGENGGNWRDVNYGTVICQNCSPEQAQRLNAKLDAASATRTGTQIRETDSQGNTVIKDIYGAYIGGFDKEGNKIDFDRQGNVIAKYDKNGNLLSSYSYNPDGSVEIYDANGKLTGLKNAREITPTQAAELTKPGKNNTVTLTFK